MALANHPNVFEFERKLWVSTAPREVARAELAAQREWDRERTKQERWWVAIVIGAIAGVLGTLALSTLGTVNPVWFLFLLPIGFAVGAVLGAVVNKRLLGIAPGTPSERPTLTPLTRIPLRVARQADDTATVAELVEWSTRGFVK